MLIATPSRDAVYFRGLGILGHLGRSRHAGYKSPLLSGLKRYGLGQDEGTGDDSYIYNAEDTSNAGAINTEVDTGVTNENYNDPDYAIIGATAGAQAAAGTIPITDAALPSTLSAPTGSTVYPSSAAPGTVTGTINGQPAVVNSAGVVVPGVVNSAGQIVPQNSVITALEQVPASYWLIGIGLLLVVSLAGKKRK